MAAGLAALMCSGVGVAMVIAVGVATLVRRGWRVAARHTVPLGAIFATWWVVCESWGVYHLGQGPVHVDEVWSFVVTGVGATFGSLVQLPLTAWLLGAVLVVGLVLAWVQTPPAERTRRFAILAGLLVGLLAFVVICAVGRAHEGAAHSREGRYLQIQAALLVPPLALAADALLRRWRVLVPVVIALFLIGIPGNIGDANTYARSRKPNPAVRNAIASIGRMSLAATLPSSFEPFSGSIPALTIGWLRDAARSGRLPADHPLVPLQQSQYRLQLSLKQTHRTPTPPCRSLSEPVTMTLGPHQSFGTRGGGITVTDLAPANGVSASLAFSAGEHVLTALARPLTLSVATTFPAAPAELCGS